MKLPSFLASDTALEGFLRGFFAPVYLLMSFFEKREIKKETTEKIDVIERDSYGNVYNRPQEIAKEKAANIVFSERLIKSLNDNPNDYNYLKLLAHRLHEAIIDDNAFEFKKILGQINAYSPNFDLPDESVTFRVEFRKMVLALGFYVNTIEKFEPLNRAYKNTHLQAMENVMAFRNDSLKPYKKLVDAHEKAK